MPYINKKDYQEMVKLLLSTEHYVKIIEDMKKESRMFDDINSKEQKAFEKDISMLENVIDTLKEEKEGLEGDVEEQKSYVKMYMEDIENMKIQHKWDLTAANERTC